MSDFVSEIAHCERKRSVTFLQCNDGQRVIKIFIGANFSRKFDNNSNELFENVNKLKL